jgi:serine/threonine-protein kinase
VALRELLDGALPDDQQRALAGHLDTCVNCQQTLEALAAGGEPHPTGARWLGQQLPSPEPALCRAIHELRGQAGGASPGEGPALDFLDPAGQPGHLGKLGPYEVLEVVGWGSMGIVLKAFDPAVHRVVALKVLAPQLAANDTARRRFLREARAAAVGHEHVVLIHDVKEAKGLPYIVMQYVAGLSLQERISRGGPLAVGEVVRIGVQAAAGLAAAHARGLIHRDIKPANILLEAGTDRVRITDFGLARAVDDDSLTQRGALAGTPQYMAPEQARGEALDHRADLFSLGSVLYALCTGRSPFRAATTLAVLQRVCESTPTPIREINPAIPDWLEAVIARLHAKAPADRFQTAGELAEVLGQYLKDGQPPAPAPAGPASPSAPQRRRVGRWIALGALLPLLALGAWAVGARLRPRPGAVAPPDLPKEEEKVKAPASPAPAEGPRQPDPALGQLLVDLKAANPWARKAVAGKLADMRPYDRDREAVARALEPLLDDPDHFTRQEMIRALGTWGTNQSVPALVRMLDNKDVFTRHAALAALGKFRDVRAAEAIAQRLPEDTPAASRALEVMGPVAEKAAAGLLSHPDWRVRGAACKVLAVIGTKQSVPALEGAAQDSAPFVPREAREALAAIYRRP